MSPPSFSLPCRVYDKLTTRQEKPLERTKRAFRSVSTSDDPIVRYVVVLTLVWLLDVSLLPTAKIQPEDLVPSQSACGL